MLIPLIFCFLVGQIIFCFIFNNNKAYIVEHDIFLPCSQVLYGYILFFFHSLLCCHNWGSFPSHSICNIPYSVFCTAHLMVVVMNCLSWFLSLDGLISLYIVKDGFAWYSDLIWGLEKYISFHSFLDAKIAD